MAHKFYCFCGACRRRIPTDLRFCDRCGAPTQGPQPAVKVAFGAAAVHGERIPDQIIRMFDGLLLLSHIGAGGMGDVYQAMDPRSGQYFALKLVRSGAGVSETAVRRLKAESAVQARIVHPNVVRMFELRFDQQTRQMAILQELVVGQPLNKLLAERKGCPMPIPDVNWFLSEMCRGLAVVHDHHYVHADIKPSNFLLANTRGQQALKLTDFGIARSLRGALDASMLGAGTPGYMSPEQIRGEPLTPVSDLYSLGCVLYEMASGRPVFTGSSQALDQLHQFEAPRAISEIRNDVPPALLGLIEELLQKSPAARGYRNAEDLKQACDRQAFT